MEMAMKKRVFFIFVVKCMMVVFVSANATAGSPNLKAHKACKRKFSEDFSYKAVNKWHIIHEYEDKTDYHLRANIDVVTKIFNQTVTIGYDCTVYLPNNHIVVFVDTKPYLEEKIPQVGHGEQIMRVKWAGSACPSLSHWKKFSDEMRKMNYKYNLPKPCFVVKQSTQVSGPIKIETYDGNDFMYIRVGNGNKYWMEKVSF